VLGGRADSWLRGNELVGETRGLACGVFLVGAPLGPREVDAEGLAYYHVDWAVQDIAGYAEQALLDSLEGTVDYAQAYPPPAKNQGVPTPDTDSTKRKPTGTSRSRPGSRPEQPGGPQSARH